MGANALFQEFQSDPYNKDLTTWQKRGISFDQGEGLMMGNAFVVFDIDINKTPIESVPEVVAELKKTVSKFASKYVRYHNQKTILHSGVGLLHVTQ